jgi:hypothetical protein
MSGDTADNDGAAMNVSVAKNVRTNGWVLDGAGKGEFVAAHGGVNDYIDKIMFKVRILFLSRLSTFLS